MPKNILMVIDSFGMGGAEKVVLTLSKGLIELGHHIDLVILDDKVDFDLPKEITLYTLGFQKGLFDYIRYEIKLHALVDLIAKKHRDGFDGIFVHLQKATRLMRRYAHPKMYFCVHSTISMSSLHGRRGLRLAIKRRRLQKIYNNLNIITVSDGIKNDLLDVVGVKPLSIKTIYNPIDIQEINLLSKEKLPNMIKGDYIIHVGRLAESKRHDRLLDAYKASGIDAKLLIVGEGNMRASIEKKITEMNIDDKVILYGFSSNPYPLIANAKLLVLTSDYEGFGNVLVEAMCLGVPVLSTDCPSGPKEILFGEVSASLVPIENTSKLAERIKSFKNSVKSDIYKEVAKKYDSHKIVKKYIDCLN